MTIDLQTATNLLQAFDSNGRPLPDGPAGYLIATTHSALRSFVDLAAKLAETEAERDAAVSDLQDARKTGVVSSGGKSELRTAVTRLTTERDAAINNWKEALRQRDEHRASLNRIADLLHVVHEDPKIEAAVSELNRLVESAVTGVQQLANGSMEHAAAAAAALALHEEGWRSARDELSRVVADRDAEVTKLKELANKALALAGTPEKNQDEAWYAEHTRITAEVT